MRCRTSGRSCGPMETITEQAYWGWPWLRCAPALIYLLGRRSSALFAVRARLFRLGASVKSLRGSRGGRRWRWESVLIELLVL